MCFRRRRRPILVAFRFPSMVSKNNRNSKE
ncbi:MAG: hypothetical protein ACI90V_010557 [Bacillariaceae sp.]|jgi:hypothetical protein